LNLNLSLFIKLVVPLTLLGAVTLPGIAEEASVFLDPPGLRFSKDPSTVIPAHHGYPNKG
jgi:hypothetical protein